MNLERNGKSMFDNSTRNINLFITDFSVVDRIINHSKLTLVAPKPKTNPLSFFLCFQTIWAIFELGLTYSDFVL